jgi:2-isopropylmalate synthase
MINYKKYQPYKTISLPDRTWPSKKILKAPIWCSVDLRDGNQSLEIPMGLNQKLEFFHFLVKMGFKEIEIGFPAASDTEFEFCRKLIEDDLIPEDVTIQVLTQCRKAIIEKTFTALIGAKKAIVHLYNSTSTLQRNVVFNKSKEEIIELAEFGAKICVEQTEKFPDTKFRFEYSPESFTATEMDYAIEISNKVLDILQPDANNKVIVNLPSTVEMGTPNLYADQIEYVCRNIKYRKNVIISLHAHNDRGTAVAASELALLAGADRIEGTLFGNGERTGNADLLTIAMNMYTQGIDPLLDFSNIQEIIKIFETSTNMNVGKRHPYAGELVYTAFSGSHQDAIKKGMKAMKNHPSHWEVPYLPIDPMDVGQSYDPIIRINSQSGKGGVSYILEHNFGIIMPKSFQRHVGLSVTKVSDEKQSELTPKEIYNIFNQNYVNKISPIKLQKYRTTQIDADKDQINIEADILLSGKIITINGIGNGVISAFCNSIEKYINLKIDIIDYTGHSLSLGTEARAISYIEAKYSNGKTYFGVGNSSSVGKSSLRAVVSTMNKILIERDKN